MSSRCWADQPSAPIESVIIVGAGPLGLLLGIFLAKANIQVILLEASDRLDENPRAAHYAPLACYDMDRAGVLEDVRAQGFHPNSVCWRNPYHSLIGGIRNDSVKIDYPLVCLPLDRLDRLLLQHFQRLPNATIKFEHKVISIKQDSDSASVEIELKDKSTTWLTAAYVVGADGANSQIRRSLHGDLDFPGETLEHQVIATNVYYDFSKFGYWDSNFIIHPENWYMAARITQDGMWRVTYGDVWGLSRDVYIARQPTRYEEILPGNPRPGDYKLVSMSPYKLHQRIARRGIADVGSLYDALMAIHTKAVPTSSILTEYSDARIRKWKTIIDPLSRKNFDLIQSQQAREEFFAVCERAEKDPDLARTMANSTHDLREDFQAFITGMGSKPIPDRAKA